VTLGDTATTLKTGFSNSPFVILRTVQDSEDDNGVALYSEEEFVGKPTREHAAEPTVVNRKSFRVGLQSQQRFGDRGQELIA
jgi:hypothetical protein